jgi:hypothetical protein
MLKLHTFKLLRDMHFEQTLLTAGTVVGVLQSETNVDVSQLLSLVQYNHVSIETTEVDKPELESIHDDSGSHVPTPNEDDTSEFDSEHVSDDLQDESELTPKPESDLASLGLDEVCIESLAANQITTKEQLKEFVDSGKNLVDLEKIGPTRAKKILAAMASHQ